MRRADRSIASGSDGSSSIGPVYAVTDDSRRGSRSCDLHQRAPGYIITIIGKQSSRWSTGRAGRAAPRRPEGCSGSVAMAMRGTERPGEKAHPAAQPGTAPPAAAAAAWNPPSPLSDPPPRSRFYGSFSPPCSRGLEALRSESSRSSASLGAAPSRAASAIFYSHVPVFPARHFVFMIVFIRLRFSRRRAARFSPVCYADSVPGRSRHPPAAAGAFLRAGRGLLLRVPLPEHCPPRDSCTCARASAQPAVFAYPSGGPR